MKCHLDVRAALPPVQGYQVLICGIGGWVELKSGLEERAKFFPLPEIEFHFPSLMLAAIRYASSVPPVHILFILQI